MHRRWEAFRGERFILITGFKETTVQKLNNRLVVMRRHDSFYQRYCLVLPTPLKLKLRHGFPHIECSK